MSESNNSKKLKLQRTNINDEDNPILKTFKVYRQELDVKHDRYERIVKLSRDITIESKRIIFLLHSIDPRKDNKCKVLEEAAPRLKKLINVNFKAIAKELFFQDIYQFRGAFTAGVQEFIEAYSFMEYMMSNINDDTINNTTVMSNWLQLQEKMYYSETDNTELQEYNFFIDPSDYILGIADLTGELMRCCINSLGSGDIDVCLHICKTLQYIYKGYLSLNPYCCRELSRKISTLRQSLLKAEYVCYNIRVRGGEAARWGLFLDKTNEDIDKEYF